MSFLPFPFSVLDTLATLYPLPNSNSEKGLATWIEPVSPSQMKVPRCLVLIPMGYTHDNILPGTNLDLSGINAFEQYLKAYIKIAKEKRGSMTEVVLVILSLAALI